MHLLEQRTKSVSQSRIMRLGLTFFVLGIGFLAFFPAYCFMSCPDSIELLLEAIICVGAILLLVGAKNRISQKEKVATSYFIFIAMTLFLVVMVVREFLLATNPELLDQIFLYSPIRY